jgi:hypothetical protein
LPGGGGVREVAASRRAPRDVDRVLSIARAEVGVREVGQNGGKRVGEYLAYTGIKVPAPYCASFVSWCFGQAGYKVPRTAWSPALFPKERMVNLLTLSPHKGDFAAQLSASLQVSRGERGAIVPGLVFGTYFPELKRIGHCGFVEEVRGEWVQTIEGNTGPEGSREGIGVFRRLRHKRTICKYADWF